MSCSLGHEKSPTLNCNEAAVSARWVSKQFLNGISAHNTPFRCYKKVLRETQTLDAGCSKAEPKNFAPLQTPFPGAQDGQNLNSWR